MSFLFSLLSEGWPDYQVFFQEMEIIGKRLLVGNLRIRQLPSSDKIANRFVKKHPQLVFHFLLNDKVYLGTLNKELDPAYPGREENLLMNFKMEFEENLGEVGRLHTYVGLEKYHELLGTFRLGKIFLFQQNSMGKINVVIFLISVSLQ